MKKCSNCAMDNPDEATVCQHCGTPFAAVSVQAPGVPVADPIKAAAVKSASNALTMSIIGFFCFGIILGPIAISQAKKAKAVLVDGDAGYSNAKTAEIIGWIVTVLSAIGIIVGIINAATGGGSYY